jgi:hypothetical protein
LVREKLESSARSDALAQELAHARADFAEEGAALRRELDESRRQHATAAATLDEICGSKGWRLLQILRRIKTALLPR